VLGAVLLLLGIVGGARGQAATEQSQAERQAVIRAAELRRGGHLDEARAVLEALLRRYPASARGLTTLLQLGTVQSGSSRKMLPFAERAVQATGGRNAVIRQAWVRTLLAADLGDSARAVSRRWVAEQPGQVMAYLSAAEAARRMGHPEEAVALLRSGRVALHDQSAFVQELASLFAEEGDYASAAGAWVRMLGWGEAGIAAVRRRLANAGTERGRALALLSERLREPTVPSQIARSGVELLLRLGRFDSARRLARELTERLPSEAGTAFLQEYVLSARNHTDLAGAIWAAHALARRAMDPAERLQWRGTAADMMWEAGDREAAAGVFEKLAREAEPASETRKLSLRRLFTLRASRDPKAAAEILREMVRSAPPPPHDQAEMALELSDGFLARGRLDAAAKSLAGIPDSISELPLIARVARARGQVALYRGRPAEARGFLETAAVLAGGDPAARTETLDLLRALADADSAEAVVLGSALFRLRAVKGSFSLDKVIGGWDRMAASPARPALLAVLARRLENAGRRDEAARVRARLIDRFPDAPEVATALLGLARSEVERDPDKARASLERLILGFPDSAVAPLARRLLAQLREAIPNS